MGRTPKRRTLKAQELRPETPEPWIEVITGLSTDMISSELVTIDATPNSYMAAHDPAATVNVSFQLVFGTALNRILGPLKQLTATYDYGFRLFILFWSLAVMLIRLCQ